MSPTAYTAKIQALVQHAWDRQRKPVDRGEELLAVVSEHPIFAFHGSHRGFYHGPAGVAEDLARLEVGLLAYDALTANLLDLAVGVGYQPVAVEQLRRGAAGVADRDRIGKHVAVCVRVGLIVDVRGFDANLEFVCVVLAHAQVLFCLIPEATVGAVEKQVCFRLHPGCRHKKGTVGDNRPRLARFLVELRTRVVRRLFWILVGLSLVMPAFGYDAAAKLVGAATAGKATEVRELLVQGVDANTKNGSGRPVLVMAGFNGNRRTALVLLAAGADVNAVDASGTSALMAASAFGHKELVDVLLVAGADANLKDSAGKSALARATLAGHQQVVEALKAAGAVEDKGRK